MKHIKLKGLLNEDLPNRGELRKVQVELEKSIGKNGSIASRFKGLDTFDNSISLLYGKYGYGINKDDLPTDFSNIQKSVKDIQSKFPNLEITADKDDKYITIDIMKK